MRVVVTLLAVVFVLAAFGPTVTGTAFGDDNGTLVGGNAGTVGVQAVPPAPVRTFSPTPAPAPSPTAIPSTAPVPAQTSVPAPAVSPAPAGQIRGDVGIQGMPQAPDANVNAGVSGNANVVGAGNQHGDQWRYRWHNNNWWYWTTENRWVYRSGNDWVNYDPTVTTALESDSSRQPAYYQSNQNSYYSSPYGYSTGYRGYYSPTYQGGYYTPGYQGGYYYGSGGGYYGQPRFSIGVGLGRGFRGRW